MQVDSHLTPDNISQYLEMNYAYWVSLTFLLCEYIATISFEFHCIWKRPMTTVKLIYVWSRYFSVFVPLANFAILKVPLTYLPIPPNACLGWYIFQATAFYLLYQPFSAISLLRVYAMYNKTKAVGSLLSALWITEAFLSIFACLRVLMLMEFDVICYGTIAPAALWLFGGVVMFTHMVALLMTTSKRSAGRNAVDFRIVRTVLRDGIWMFALVAAIVASAVPYAFAKQVIRPHIAFAWPTSLISFTTCRLIMNMQNIQVGDTCDDSSLRYDDRSPDSIDLPPFLTDEHMIVSNSRA